MNNFQERIFTGLVTKIGSGAAALYADSCSFRRLDGVLLSARMLVAHALREMRAAIAEKLTSPGEDFEKLRTQLHELAHRRDLRLPEPIDAVFLAEVQKIEKLLLRILDDLDLRADEGAVSDLGIRDAIPTVHVANDDIAAQRQLMEKHVAPGPAAYYHDALMLQRPDFRVLFGQANYIAHCLREAESGLRRVTLPVGFKANRKTGDTQLQQVRAVLAAYGIAAADPAGAGWLALATQAQSLAKYAHHNGPGAPAPLDEQRATLYRGLVDTFGVLLDRFEHDFGKYIHRLDSFIASPTPQATAFLNELPQTEIIYDYFFRRLENPAWLAELRDTDVFRRTPEPVRDGEFVEYPAWPQGFYLHRLLARATLPPSEVWEVVEQATNSVNPRVHEHILACALLLPPPLRLCAAEAEMRATERLPFIPFRFAEGVGELALALAGDGEKAMAVAAMRAVLRLEHHDDGLRLGVDRLAFERLLQKVPQLALACGTSLLAVVVDLLETWRVATSPTLVPPVDHSLIWRPRIAPDELNLAGDLRGAMVEALRDGAAAIAASDPSNLRSVVEFLLSQRWNIHRRIALHLVAVREDGGLAAELVQRRELIESDDCSPEMKLLLDAHATSLPPEVRDATREFDVVEGGVGRVGFVEPVTPLTRDDLARQEVADIFAFLRAWRPGGLDLIAFQQDSPSELANELRAVVATRPDEYLSAANSLRELAPVYVRGVIEGLTDAARNRARVTWEALPSLLAVISSAPREANDHRLGARDPDKSWLYVRLATLELIEQLIFAGALPASAVESVEAFLGDLMLDPSPSAEEDAEGGATFGSWLSLTTGSVRARATGTAIVFGHWASQQLKSEEATGVVSWLTRGLDERLRDDPSPGARFAIGSHFSRLLFFAPNWAAERVVTIFGIDVPSPAWVGFLNNPASRQSFALLRPLYARAVATLDAKRSETAPVEKLLVQHLSALYAHGEITLADDLIAQFFANASAALAHELWFVIGRHLHNDPPPEAVARFTALWEWRVDRGTPAELRAFDQWALSKALPRRWMLEQLLALATRGIGFLGYWNLVDALFEIFDTEPARTLAVVRALTKSETEGAMLHAARLTLETYVRAGIDSTDEIVRNEARMLANILTARGFDNFKQFV